MKDKVPRAWTHLAEGPVEDHRVLKVRRLQVADPRDGSRHERVVMESADWCNVIPVTRQGDVLLVRQFRFGVWDNTLEIPGGLVDPGESPEHSAGRELEEETGYRAGRLIHLGSCHPNPALFGNRVHCFLALDCERVHEGRLEATEDIVVERVSRPEVDQMLRDGRISHALVLVAFLFERLAPK